MEASFRVRAAGDDDDDDGGGGGGGGGGSCEAEGSLELGPQGLMMVMIINDDGDRSCCRFLG